MLFNTNKLQTLKNYPKSQYSASIEMRSIIPKPRNTAQPSLAPAARVREEPNAVHGIDVHLGVLQGRVSEGRKAPGGDHTGGKESLLSPPLSAYTRFFTGFLDSR